MSTLGTAGAYHIATAVDTDVDASFSGVWAGNPKRLTGSFTTSFIASAWSTNDTAVVGDYLIVVPLHLARGTKLANGSWFEPEARISLVEQSTSKHPWAYVKDLRKIKFSFDYDTTDAWFGVVMMARHNFTAGTLWGVELSCRSVNTKKAAQAPTGNEGNVVGGYGLDRNLFVAAKYV